MRKYIFLYIIIILACPFILEAQNTDYAGPDQTACQGVGALIGNTNPGNVCYTWDAADGLDPGDIHKFFPVVKPQHTTTYTVHVTGSNFNFSTTDQVKVSVEYGGLVVNPSYINLTGTLENQATAVLNINDLFNPGPNIWSIPDAGSTGCAIDQNGKISGCNQDATVTVKVMSTNYPDCFAQKELKINGGIKEVVVSDNSNDGRMAKNGTTLYLVGPVSGSPTNNVNVKAVPNDNSSFPSGQPVWSGDFPPPPGNLPSFDSQPLNLGTYHETAGTTDPKTATVTVVGPDEFNIGATIQTGLFEDAVNKMKGNTKVKETDAFCSMPLTVGLPGAITGSYKSSNVPKFKDPNYDVKREYVAEIPGFSITGCVYFPCCTGGVAFGPVFIYYFTYLGATLGFNLNIAGGKDPSASADPMWQFTNLSAAGSGKVEAGLRVESEFASNAGVTAGANLSTEAKIDIKYVPTPDHLEWNLSYGGLVGKVFATVWYGSTDDGIEVSFQKSLLPGSETGYKLLYNFPNQ